MFKLLSINLIRLKKNTLSQSLREFFKPTRHAVFYFLFYFFFTSIGLCLRAHAKPKMTEKFQLPYFQKSNGTLHVFWTPTCLNSSKTANFLLFRSKNEKKIISRKKNESLNFAKSNAHRKTNVGDSFETQNFFFFSLSTLLSTVDSTVMNASSSPFAICTSSTHLFDI